jgi:hypothetical protein
VPRSLTEEEEDRWSALTEKVVALPALIAGRKVRALLVDWILGIDAR